MPHSFGSRARTRDMFSRPFRQRGMIKMSTYMTTYKLGDYVDIKCNPAQVKGMRDILPAKEANPGTLLRQ